MNEPLVALLRVRESEGGWAAQLGAAGRRAAEGSLPAWQLVELERALSEALQPPRRVLLRGRDAETTEAEERAGQQLLQALCADPALAAAWSELRGEARGRGAPLRLAVDVLGARLSALPWELLTESAEGGQLEVSGGLVARLCAGEDAPPRAGSLRLRRWVPWRGDPVVEARLQALEALSHDLGLELIDALEEPARAGDVLHIITHGARAGDPFRLVAEGVERAGAEALAALQGALRGCRLAVLEVCHGGACTRSELGDLGRRLVAAGVPACLAPGQALGASASQAFLEGLYQGLVEGQDLPEATRAGRLRVREAGDPRPEERWHGFQLLVSTVSELAEAEAAGWRPEGWPRPAPEAAALLLGARELAERRGHGFVGLEHLCLALERAPGGGPLTARVRVKLGDAPARLLARLSRLEPQPEGQPDWRGTPRLRRWAGTLPPGFDLDALWRCVAEDPHHGLHALVDGGLLPPEQSPETVDPSLFFGEAPARESGPRGFGPAGALELIGGPEDGRVLRLRPGQSLGRAWEGAGAAPSLYAGTALGDRRLSRKALTWVGPGQLQLHRPAVLERWGQRQELRAPALSLSIGEQLLLTRSTRLLAVAGGDTDDSASPE
ncbi:MAG: CHAT domain-containing protein [Alphaproteobacteria bacterium]|nr:CHAT domain-containing protein [Alphaproteobacteria bacterium]MCB9796594.1 CHAT domain-containing protein [Alphaproteobacteria bacterium]